MNQQPVSAQKPAVSKWLWITLIIVILAAGAFAAWYFLMGQGKKVETSTTTDKTAGWQTYENKTYGFSFKYPKDWIAEDEDISKLAENIVVQSGYVLTKVTFENSDNSSLKVYDLDKQASTFTNFKDKSLQGFVNYFRGKATSTPLNVNGISYIKITEVDPDRANITDRGFFALKDNKIIEILDSYPKGDSEKAQTFETLISTFQFTK